MGDEVYAIDIPDNAIEVVNSYDTAFQNTFSHETDSDGNGLYTEPNGDTSNYGWTQKTENAIAKKEGRQPFDVKNIKPDYVKEKLRIYHWEEPGIGKIADDFGSEVATTLFDFEVQSGNRESIKALQRVVGSKDDGIYGPNTKKAVQSYIDDNGSSELIEDVLNERSTFINNAIKNNPNLKKIEKGLQNRIKNEKKNRGISLLDLFITEAHAGEIPDELKEEKPRLSPTQINQAYDMTYVEAMRNKVKSNLKTQIPVEGTEGESSNLDLNGDGSLPLPIYGFPMVATAKGEFADYSTSREKYRSYSDLGNNEQEMYAIEIPEGAIEVTGNTFGNAVPSEISSRDKGAFEDVSRVLENAWDFVTGKNKELDANDAIAIARQYNVSVSDAYNNLEKFRENIKNDKKRKGLTKDELRGMAFKESLIEGVTFGIIESDDILDMSFPMASGAGSVLGAFITFPATYGVLNAIKFPKMAYTVGQSMRHVASFAPRYVPASLVTGTVFSTQSGIREAVKQAKSGEFNVVSILGQTSKGFIEGATIGAVSVTTGHAGRIAMSGTVGYVSAKIDGANHNQALVQAGLFAAVEMVGGRGRDKRLKDIAYNDLRSTMVDAYKKQTGKSTKEAIIATDNYLAKQAKDLGGIKKAVQDSPVKLFEKLTKEIYNFRKYGSSKAKAKYGDVAVQESGLPKDLQAKQPDIAIKDLPSLSAAVDFANLEIVGSGDDVFTPIESAKKAIAEGKTLEEFVGSQNVVYHGTKSENIQISDRNLAQNKYGKGVYVTPNKELAKKRYAQGDGNVFEIPFQEENILYLDPKPPKKIKVPTGKSVPSGESVTTSFMGEKSTKTIFVDEFRDELLPPDRKDLYSITYADFVVDEKSMVAEVKPELKKLGLTKNDVFDINKKNNRTVFESLVDIFESKGSVAPAEDARKIIEELGFKGIYINQGEEEYYNLFSVPKTKAQLTDIYNKAKGQQSDDVLAAFGDVSPSGKVEVSQPPHKTVSQLKALEKKRANKEVQKSLPLDDKFIANAAYDVLVERSQRIALRTYETNKYVNTLIHGTTETERQAITLLIEGAGVPDDLKGSAVELAYNRQAEELRPLVEEVSKHLDEQWQYFLANSDGMPTSEIENYVTHLWDFSGKDKKSKIAEAVSYFTTRNRFAKKRFIDSYKQGMDELGLKPKTLDVAKIIQVHDSAINKSVANKIFVKEIKNLEELGVKLYERSDIAPRDWVLVDHPEFRKNLVIPGELKRGEKTSEELKALLHELGVVIGRRINPQVFGKPNTKLGSFKPSATSPEIRLQRFFSTETLAHEIGHFIDQKMNLTGLAGSIGGMKGNFFEVFKDELFAVNKDRIDAFKDKPGYAETPAEQTAEYFALLFTNPDKAIEIAPKTTAHILARFAADDSLSKLAGFDFQNKAKNLIDDQLTTIIKMPVKVHPSIAKAVQTVLDGRFKGGVVDFYEAVGGILKKGNLSLSLFHHFALGETAVPTIGVLKTLDIGFNLPKIYKALANGEYYAYQNEEAAKLWINHGVQIGATADIPVQRIQDGLDFIANKLKNIPVLAQASKLVATFNEVWDKALWAYYHDTLKLYACEALSERYIDYQGDVSKQRDEIAQMVNDTFGGQNWERQLISPKTVQVAGWALLSPDWFASTMKQAMSPTGAGAIHKETKKMRAKMGVAFWAKAALYFGVGINLLNVALRKIDQKKHPELYKGKERNFIDNTLVGNAVGHKTHLFAGRYEDGTERYIRWGKQFRELPEMLFDDTGTFNPISASAKKIGGKASPQLQLLSEVFTGHSLSGFKNRDIADTNGWEKTYGIAKRVLSSPLPFSLRTIGQDDKEFFVSDIAMPSSKGMTRYKAKEYFKESFETGNERLFKEVYQDALDNNLPAPMLVTEALSSLKAEATRERNSQIKNIDDIKAMFDDATPEVQKSLLRTKRRLLKEKDALDRGIEVLEASLDKLKAQGYFDNQGDQ